MTMFVTDARNCSRSSTLAVFSGEVGKTAGDKGNGGLGIYMFVERSTARPL